MTKQITVRLPYPHWIQIVNDIENMCGVSSDKIEVLSKVEIVDNDAEPACSSHLYETHFTCTRKPHLTAQVHSCTGVDGTIITWFNKDQQS